MEAKVCGNCKQEKPASAFYPKKSGGGGLEGQCKLCRREAQQGKKQKWEAVRPSLDPDARKTCGECGLEKPVSEFYLNPDCRDGRASRCTVCTNIVRRGQAAERAKKPPPGSKVCRGCGQDKPLAEFSAHPTGKFGRHPRCGDCRSRERGTGVPTADIIERPVALSKVCRVCSTEKDAAEFYSNPENLDGLSGACISCVRRKRREAAPKGETPPNQTCRACGEEKPASEFYAHSGFSTGIESRCKECKKKARQAQKRLQQGASPSEVSRNYQQRLKKLYGLSLGDYQRMLTEQGFRCFICRAPATDKGLCVDHDHLTGEVRGLLCGTCNSALGFLDYLRSDPDRLSRALSYLKRSRSYGGQLLQPRGEK